ncbi:MAG: TetR/AcrR family transcriptional regulator, partial [Solimonas sp.]
RYHHGDLRAALIAASDELLAEHGLAGFSLREAARRAGVSAAAPAHHFGDAAGLLSEVAALGFRELSAQLDIGGGGATPLQRLRLQGVAYVRFALRHPGRFQLMFRRELLSPDHAGLQEAGARALEQLTATVRAIRGLAPDAPLAADDRAVLLGAWATVHGFAHLALDGKLADLSGVAAQTDLLDTVLPQMLLAQWPDR